MDTFKPVGKLLSSVSESIGIRDVQCPKHGAYSSSGERIKIGKGKEIWTPCPGCKADADREHADEIKRAAAAAKSAELEAMLRQTAIPSRFIGRNFDNYQVTCDGQDRALAMCREYAENFSRHAARGASLIFSGGVGTGKSHLAAAILQDILPGHIGAYLTVSDLFRMVRDTWRPSSAKSESQVLAELADLPLLVIDEVGVQRGNAEDHNLLFDIMDRRYRDRRSSILLTNEDKVGLEACVGDRVFDRLRETARWISFDWPSSRVQARKDFE